MSTRRSKKSRRKKRNTLIVFTVLLALVAVIIVMLCILTKNLAKIAAADEDGQSTQAADDVEDSSDETETELIAEGLVIVIDPGHGFGDVGNESGYLENNEAFYTVLYAQEIQEKLEAMGATVFLTHDGETFPSETEMAAAVAEYGLVFSSPAVTVTEGDNLFNKYERVIYASILDYEYGVDFFLSVHFNSNEVSSVEGCAIYYCETSPGTDISLAFAESVMAEMGYPSNYSGIYCDTYDEAFAVTKYGDFPAVLIECAFMTNADDAANIGSYTWRDQVTTLIAESIVEALTGQEIE